MKQNKFQFKNGLVAALLITAVLFAGSSVKAFADEPAKKTCCVTGFFEGVGKFLEKTYNNMTGKTVEEAKPAA